MFTRHVSQQIAAHLDGRLAADQAHAVELHLRECPNCHAERDQISQGMGALEHLPLVEAPAEIWAAVEAAFREQQSARPSTVPRWRWAFAAIVILVLAGILSWRFTHSA